jgi:polar amino acid transport system substrate-binding protein
LRCKQRRLIRGLSQTNQRHVRRPARKPSPKGAETVAALENGKADALIETDVAVADMVSKSGGKLEEVKSVFPTSTQFAVYTSKGSAISAPLKTAIADLIASGTLTAIATKYGLDSAKLTSDAKPLP